MKNFGKLQACTGNTFLKKCDDTVSKVFCAFCQSADITEVCSYHFQMLYLDVPKSLVLNGKYLYFLEGVWRDGSLP